MTNYHTLQELELIYNFTPQVLRVLDRAATDCGIYKKKSVLSTFLLFSLIAEGVNFDIPLDKARLSLQPDSQQVPEIPVYSPLITQALDNARRVVEQLQLDTLDLGSLILGFLELQQGPHLELMKQFNVSAQLLHQEYTESYIQTKILDPTTKLEALIRLQYLGFKSMLKQLEYRLATTKGNRPPP